MDQTPVDVLNIASPHQISVRPRSWKENYYKFERALEVFCYDSQERLSSVQGGETFKYLFL